MAGASKIGLSTGSRNGRHWWRGRPIAPAPGRREVSRTNAAEAKSSDQPSGDPWPEKYQLERGRQGHDDDRKGVGGRRSTNVRPRAEMPEIPHAREPELTEGRRYRRSKQVQRGEQRIGAGPRAQQPRRGAAPRLIPQQAEPQEEPRPRAPQRLRSRRAPRRRPASRRQPGRSRPARGREEVRTTPAKDEAQAARADVVSQ